MLFFCPGVSPPWSFTHCSIIELLYEHSTQNYLKTGLIFAAFGHFMSYIAACTLFSFLVHYILFFSLIQYYLLTCFLLSCKEILLQSMIINSCWQIGV